MRSLWKRPPHNINLLSYTAVPLVGTTKGYLGSGEGQWCLEGRHPTEKSAGLLQPGSFQQGKLALVFPTRRSGCSVTSRCTGSENAAQVCLTRCMWPSRLYPWALHHAVWNVPAWRLPLRSAFCRFSVFNVDVYGMGCMTLHMAACLRTLSGRDPAGTNPHIHRLPLLSSCFSSSAVSQVLKYSA